MMTIYIALLRGINVGGNNKIKMADLKAMFQAMGFSQVQTYIQSGNVLFESNEEEEFLRERIENEIKTVFGFSVPVVLRTASELEQVIGNCPFSEEAVSKAKESATGECLYVALLTQAPSREGIERLNAYKSESEEFRIEGREVYLLFSDSIRNSKLANHLQKLDEAAPVRNWKTINKLVMLAEAIV